LSVLSSPRSSISAFMNTGEKSHSYMQAPVQTV